VRRRLVLVVLATTSLVVVAFAIPLGVLVRSVARDRAIADAERDVASLTPTLARPGVTSADVDEAIEIARTRADGRITVWLADDPAEGADAAGARDDTALAYARQGHAFTVHRDGSLVLYQPVVTGTGTVTAVVRATIPGRLLDDGVRTAWLALAGVALALIAAAGFIADRLARSVTRDATELSGTARALAAGDGEARADPGPTPELADAARALNLLADRIDELRASERERVADLSHRLRTPLTALRLDAESAGDPALVADVERLESAISELIHSARRPLHDGVVAPTADLAAVARERAEFWSALAEDDGRPWTVDVDRAGRRSPDARGDTSDGDTSDGDTSDGDPDDGGRLVVALSPGEAAAAIDALVGNVFAHTPEGTAYTVRVRLGDDGSVHLVVEDAGPGIDDPEAVLGRGATTGGSTGLGLDIARRAAEDAGGQLRIEPSDLGGTRVVLALPLAGRV
jgi:signal transduction histidine kinase